MPPCLPHISWLPQQRCNELLKEVAEVRQDYAQGNVKFGLIADFMADLDERIVRR